MHIHKNYFHDKTILTLLALNITMLVVACLSVLLRATSASGETFVVQYRSNLKALAIKSGPLSEIRLFALFAVLVVLASWLISVRAYGHRRHVATAVLGVTPFLLMMVIVISDRLIVSS
ncbi:hypothetical protein IPO96_01170 [Candidatus Saccharibacteria bacterium]|jgi:protein-S-isoprenylcysteine O-methyltransferase Ste14|nr:MAG: hypothetical protein IPO96_01170 [Candidatus Saccharibacteria bacterium]